MYRIAVNAGHHPLYDSGAVGAYSRECDIVKDIAEIVCSDLSNVGYEVLFIQENELYDICDISNKWNADVFISIHCNAAASTQAHGTETFYHAGSSKGQKLAAAIQNQLIETLNTADRGIKNNGLYVTRNTDAVAVLVECAFISNADEEDLLNEHKKEIADAIARGVTDYMLLLQNGSI